MSARQLVVFSIGGEEYALPIEAVSEIIRHAAPRTVASDTPGVRGVIGLRGKVISVIDIADRLNLAIGQVKDGKTIILDTPSGQLGVMVDEVDEVLTISSEQLEKVPAAGPGIDAVAKLDERLVMLLDPEAFASAAEPV